MRMCKFSFTQNISSSWSLKNFDSYYNRYYNSTIKGDHYQLFYWSQNWGEKQHYSRLNENEE